MDGKRYDCNHKWDLSFCFEINFNSVSDHIMMTSGDDALLIFIDINRNVTGFPLCRQRKEVYML